MDADLNSLITAQEEEEAMFEHFVRCLFPTCMICAHSEHAAGAIYCNQCGNKLN